MPDTYKRKVQVSYRRQVSDGNYGTEAAEASLEWFIDDDNEMGTEDKEAAEEMLGQARDLVLNQLRASLSESVRRAVTPKMAPARAAVTARADDEHPF